MTVAPVMAINRRVKRRVIQESQSKVLQIIILEVGVVAAWMGVVAAVAIITMGVEGITTTVAIITVGITMEVVTMAVVTGVMVEAMAEVIIEKQKLDGGTVSEPYHKSVRDHSKISLSNIFPKIPHQKLNTK